MAELDYHILSEDIKQIEQKIKERQKNLEELKAYLTEGDDNRIIDSLPELQEFVKHDEMLQQVNELVRRIRDWEGTKLTEEQETAFKEARDKIKRGEKIADDDYANVFGPIVNSILILEWDLHRQKCRQQALFEETLSDIEKRINNTTPPQTQNTDTVTSEETLSDVQETIVDTSSNDVKQTAQKASTQPDVKRSPDEIIRWGMECLDQLWLLRLVAVDVIRASSTYEKRWRDTFVAVANWLEPHVNASDLERIKAYTDHPDGVVRPLPSFYLQQYVTAKRTSLRSKLFAMASGFALLLVMLIAGVLIAMNNTSNQLDNRDSTMQAELAGIQNDLQNRDEQIIALTADFESIDERINQMIDQVEFNQLEMQVGAIQIPTADPRLTMLLRVAYVQRVQQVDQMTQIVALDGNIAYLKERLDRLVTDSSATPEPTETAFGEATPDLEAMIIDLQQTLEALQPTLAAIPALIATETPGTSGMDQQGMTSRPQLDVALDEAEEQPVVGLPVTLRPEREASDDDEGLTRTFRKAPISGNLGGTISDFYTDDADELRVLSYARGSHLPGGDRTDQIWVCLQVTRADGETAESWLGDFHVSEVDEQPYTLNSRDEILQGLQQRFIVVQTEAEIPEGEDPALYRTHEQLRTRVAESEVVPCLP